MCGSCCRVLAIPFTRKLMYRDRLITPDGVQIWKMLRRISKDYVRKTAVLGVTGVKRKLADLLTALTGQPLKYFDDMESAKKWLIEE